MKRLVIFVATIATLVACGGSHVTVTGKQQVCVNPRTHKQVDSSNCGDVTSADYIWMYLLVFSNNTTTEVPPSTYRSTSTGDSFSEDEEPGNEVDTSNGEVNDPPAEEPVPEEQQAPEDEPQEPAEEPPAVEDDP